MGAGMTAADASTQQSRIASGGAGRETARRPPLSDRLPRAWLFPLLVIAATWLLVLAVWAGSDAIYGSHHSWTWHFLFKDANFYIRIARYGYTGDPAKAAFFPLFPLLIRLAAYLTGGNYLIAGLIVSVLTGAASALGVWAVAARVRDRWVADRAVALYCVFPGAMTFSMLYSEPLAVALSAAALLALLERRWLLAGIAGAACTAERPTLIVLSVVFGVAAAQAIWARGEWRSLLAPVLTPLGMLAYFGYLGRRTGNYAYWFYIERKGWHQHIDWGVHTLRVLLWLDPKDPRYKVFVVLLMIMAVATVAGVALMIAARLPLPVTLFGLLVVLLSIATYGTGTKPRFIWTAFPLFIGAAAKLPRYIYWPVLIVSAAILAFFIGWWPHHVLGPAP